MYFKVELPWNVVVPAEQLHGEGLLLKRSIILQLMKDISNRIATKEDGYMLAPTVLEHVGDGKVRQDSGDVLFPVVFTCITFKPIKGEILCGVVNSITRQGVFLSCGPVKEVFLVARVMGDYRYFPGENQIYQNDKGSKIEKGAQVRFMVLGTGWVENKREFRVLGTLEGDYLGPIYRGDSKF